MSILSSLKERFSMSSKLPSTVEEIQKATPLITISEPEKMQQIMPVYTDKAISVVKF